MHRRSRYTSCVFGSMHVVEQIPSIHLHCFHLVVHLLSRGRVLDRWNNPRPKPSKLEIGCDRRVVGINQRSFPLGVSFGTDFVFGLIVFCPPPPSSSSSPARRIRPQKLSGVHSQPASSPYHCDALLAHWHLRGARWTIVNARSHSRLIPLVQCAGYNCGSEQ